MCNFESSQKMKAEPSQMIPLKPTRKPRAFNCRLHCYECNKT